MAINKNFVVKNGIEVNTNLIVADTDSNKVGIGTTVPEYTLHVFQGTGIGASTINVTGVGTFLEELNVGLAGTTLTAISNATLGIGGSVGVGTDDPGYLLEVHSPVTSGQTALYVRGDMVVTGDINIDDISIGDLNVSGISTFVGNVIIGTGATVGFGSTAFFKDYAKAIFGDGEDLKVYHDGTNSYISDSGTGGLIVGSNSLTIKNAALNETQAVFTENGAVELYHDNGKRFNTNAIGVEVSGTLQSTGITTLASSGGITTTGGDLYVGGDLYINEDIVLDTNLNILGIATLGSIHVTGISTFDGDLRGPNLTNSIVVGTGLSVRGSATGVAVTLAGAGGITTTGGDLYVGGDLYINEDIVLDTNLTILGIATIGTLNLSNTSGINTIDSTVQSTSKDTGALVVEGGVGIEKQLYVGAGASVGAGLTALGEINTLRFGTPVALGADSSDAAIRIGTSGSSPFRVDYVGNVVTSGGINVTSGVSTFAGVIDANDTTNSSSSTTGAAKFAGGVGVAKNLFVGGGAEITGLTTITGVLNANNTLQATSPTSGSLATLGGLAVVKNAYIGGGQVTVGIHTITDLRVGTQLAGQTLVGITTILDEDSFASNSASALATQQSIKAYVDATTTASDLDFQGDSGGAQSVDLDSQTFTIAGTSNEIETSSSGQTLTVGLPNDVTIGNDLTVTNNVSIASSVFHTGDLNTAFGFPAADTFTVYTGGSEALRVDSSQRLLFGNTSSRSNVPGADVGFQIEGASGGPTNKRFTQHIFGSGDGSGPYLGLAKHRGTSVGGNTIVVNGDELGGIYFQGADGTNFKQGAYILAEVDGTPGTNDMPGALRFATTADGASSPTERLRITAAGKVGINTNDPNAKLQINDGLHGLEFNPNSSNAVVSYNRTTSAYGPVGLQGSSVQLRIGGTGTILDVEAAGTITTGIATFSSTKHLTVPVGTTAQRDSIVANGMIRYNTTLNSYEGYGNGAWGGLGGGTEIDTAVSSTSATNITTFAHASYRSAQLRVQITQGSAYQVGKYLLIHDGTTVTVVEESAIATGDMLGSVSSVINGSNVEVKITMNSASSATVTTIIDKITV